MKKNVFSKALALCLALVLCLGMMAGCGKKQLTAKEHFDLVATKTQKTLDDGAISLYGTTLDSLSSAEGGVTDVKISLGDAGKQLLSTLTGGQIPLDWINEIGLKIGAKVDKSLISDEIGISLNGVDLAKIQDTLDADGNKLYLAVPDLFSDVLSLDFGKLAEQAGGSLGVRFDSSALKNVLDFKSWDMLICSRHDPAVMDVWNDYSELVNSTYDPDYEYNPFPWDISELYKMNPQRFLKWMAAHRGKDNRLLPQFKLPVDERPALLEEIKRLDDSSARQWLTDLVNSWDDKPLTKHL